ncbi:NAD-dependent epimerase/dehydratase family protein [SAR86 cluster bacterium]|jgi:UDP-glucose 4-epimerase|uniref:NAD-dependent epimerase/dehydratase family protein n=1 Tax=SAR86 cluster bacterium TaxID=2030880 RepID=A0A9Q8TZ50_9GAMM|nr:NAD-dependent epimerase/dehydratase family protein [Pseudomonadota bacterium]URQ62937.1 NAD-dependent epimerase/dehydratase family protein [SAR86 cluster bacterium]URQ64007.1 NAD-dependent epimerase/dehydratase family protein [SAR86 cluster bacterium]|tara:strand:+ start:494 stop:1372 length:879 start_codon:yes stop_codon:yes gene_type:complete
MAKKVLVVGGSGFLGSHVADELTEKGYEVTIFDQKKSTWINDNQKFIESDLLDREHVIKSLEGFNFVIHFAGIADIGESKEKPLETIETNIIGTANLLEGCRKNKIEKFIFASSVYVFSKYGSFYGKSKQACELLIEEYQNEFNLDYIHVRYGSLYGPRAQEWNGLKKYISEIIKNKQIDFSGNGEEKREYIHVKDAAIMTASLLESDEKNIAVNITGHQVISTLDLFKLIFEVLQLEEKINLSKESNVVSHYKISPYSFQPKESKKLVPKKFIDIGQGVLEIIHEIEDSKN